MIALLCAVLSGAMFYLSQGLDDVWVLAWIAPLPLLWLAYNPAARWQLFTAALAAFAMGQVYFLQSCARPSADWRRCRTPRGGCWPTPRPIISA